uniref:Secreted protein n=1 Tax=Anguilla anguilla TaxID=7936 RepID=A0A0E9WMB8_ANGAN
MYYIGIGILYVFICCFLMRCCIAGDGVCVSFVCIQCLWRFTFCVLSANQQSKTAIFPLFPFCHFYLFSQDAVHCFFFL